MPTAITALRPKRIVSVDAFRGLTFAAMLFVNSLAGANGIPFGIQHMEATYDGMSLADIVFPFFMFTVGMSIPFAINSRLLKGDSTARLQWHIVYRAFGLIVMGFFMVNTEQGYNEQAVGFSVELWALLFYAAVLLVWGVYRFDSVLLNGTLRAAGVAIIVGLAAVYRSGDDGSGWMASEWWGILGAIGWTYLVTSMLYQLTRGRVPLLIGAIGLCVGFFALNQAMPMGDVLAMHATHISIVLCGLICSLLFFDTGRVDNERRRLTDAALFAAALASAATLLHRCYPISKIGATPPWALYCGALGVLLFMLLYWLIELRGVLAWVKLVEPAAANPLVTYLIPIVLAAAMRYRHLHWPNAVNHGAGALLFAVLFVAVVIGLVACLNRFNFKLKL